MVSTVGEFEPNFSWVLARVCGGKVVGVLQYCDLWLGGDDAIERLVLGFGSVIFWLLFLALRVTMVGMGGAAKQHVPSCMSCVITWEKDSARGVP